MVQMDFLAANHVRIVGLCKSVKNAKAHRADIFAIAQLSCLSGDGIIGTDKNTAQFFYVSPGWEGIALFSHFILA